MTVMRIAAPNAYFVGIDKQRLAADLIRAVCAVETGNSNESLFAGFAVHFTPVDGGDLWHGLHDASGSTKPLVHADFTVMAGPWTAALKAHVIEAASEILLAASPAVEKPAVWVTIVEVEDGGWGATRGARGAAVGIQSLMPAFDEERQKTIRAYLERTMRTSAIT